MGSLKEWVRIWMAKNPGIYTDEEQDLFKVVNEGESKPMASIEHPYKQTVIVDPEELALIKVLFPDIKDTREG